MWAGRGATVRPQSPSGAGELQLSFGGVTTKIFSKILLDMTTFTTAECYIVGTVGGNGNANIHKDEGNINSKNR